MNDAITVVLVDYCSAEETIAYLKHFRECVQSEHEFQFVIIDNSPGEENFDQLQQHICLWNVTQSKTELISNAADIGYCEKIELNGCVVLLAKANNNLGYGRGNNAGAALAERNLKQFDYIVFSNNDLVFSDGFCFDNLLEPFAQDDRVAVCGPGLKGPDGRAQNPRRFLPLWRRYTLYALLWPLNKVIVPLDRWFKDVYTSLEPGSCDYLSGSFLVCDYKKWKHAGGFDNNIFLYAEEPILGKRLQKHGYYMYCQSKAQVLHNHNQVIGKFMNNVRITKQQYQSDRYFFQQYMNEKKGILFLTDMALAFLLLKKRIVNVGLRAVNRILNKKKWR